MSMNINVRLTGDSKALEKALNSGSTSVNRFGKHVESAGRESLGAKLHFDGLIGSAAKMSAILIGAGSLSEAIHVSTERFNEQQKSARLTAQVLKDTGGVAGVTRQHVNSLADSIARKTAIDKEQVKSTEVMLLRFTNVRDVVGKGNDVFDRATQAVEDLTAAGKSATGSSMALGRALQDPVQGMAGLRRVGIVLSTQQKELIKNLQSHGDALGAQKVILDQVEKQYRGTAEAAGNTFSGSIQKLKNSFADLGAEVVRRAAPSLQHLSDVMREWVDKALTPGTRQAQQMRSVTSAISEVFGTATAIVKEAVPVFQAVGSAASKVAHAVGGWKVVLEALLALKVASEFKGWSSALGGLIGSKQGNGKGLVGAETRSGGLLSNLKGLAKMGALTIGITTLINGLQKPGMKGFMEQLLGAGAVGWSLGGPAGAAAAITVDVLYNLIKKPGGSDPSNPTSPDYTYTVGSYKGYGVAVKGKPGDTEIGTLLQRADQGLMLTKAQSKELLDYAKSHIKDGSFLGFASLAAARSFYKDSNVYDLGVNPGGKVATAPKRGAGVDAGGVQSGIVSTAKGTLGNAYGYGGAPSLSKPTDCSGLMVAVFAKNGITLPRTSQAQYASAPMKNARPLLPGDLVFSEGTHPGHVGLYIGGGMVLEDPHTGDHVKTVTLKGFGWNGLSARWWGGKTTVTGGGGGGGSTSTSSGGGADAPSIPVAQHHGHHPAYHLPGALTASVVGAQSAFGAHPSQKTLDRLIHLLQEEATDYRGHGMDTAAARIDAQIVRDRARLAKAAATAHAKLLAKVADDFIKKVMGGSAHDEQVLKVAEIVGRPASEIVADQQRLLADYEGEAKKLRGKLATATGAAKTKYQSALARVEASIRTTQDALVQSLQQSVSDASSRVSSIWGTVQSDIISQFEKQTNDHIKAMGAQFFQGGQTASESALSKMQGEDSAISLMESMQQALASGDFRQIRQAQRAITENDLSIKATAERTKADKDYADAVEAYTEKRSDTERELNNVLSDFGVGLANGTVSLYDLQGWLDGANRYGVNFGLSLSDVSGSSVAVKGDFDDLSASVSTLIAAMDALNEKIVSIVGAGAVVGTNAQVQAASEAALKASQAAGNPDWQSALAARSAGMNALYGLGVHTSACFVAGTQVSTPDGTVSIEDVQPGDLVIVWDFDGRCKTVSTVEKVQAHEGDDVRQVLALTAAGRRVYVTEEHPFWTGQRWVAARDLRVSDHVAVSGDDGDISIVRVAEIDVVDGLHPVYNLHVEHGDHNYFANGLLVHNMKMLAKGGIVVRPTQAMIGEAGPEAVIPLSRAGGLGGDTINIHVAGSVVTEGELVDTVRRELLRVGKRNLGVGLG